MKEDREKRQTHERHETRNPDGAEYADDLDDGHEACTAWSFVGLATQDSPRPQAALSLLWVARETSNEYFSCSGCDGTMAIRHLRGTRLPLFFDIQPKFRS
jgi:hypothetical protein